MKTPSTELYELIQTLTKAEKRSFKLYAQRMGSERNTIALFDAIDKQEEYNEKDILKKFKGKYTAKTLSAAKSYLYEVVLNSVLTKQDTSHHTQYVLSLMQQILLLKKKALYGQALKLILKAKKIAAELELYECLLFLSDEERHLVWKGGHNYADVEEAKSRLAEEIRLMAGTIELHNQLTCLWEEMATIRRQSAGMSLPRHREQAEKIIHSPVLLHPPDTNSFKLRKLWLVIHTLYGGICSDYAYACRYQLQNIALYEEYSPNILRFFEDYLILLYNTAVSYYGIFDYEHSEQIIDKLLKAPSLWKVAMKPPILRPLLHAELLRGSIILNQGKVEQADEVDAAVSALAQQHAGVLSPQYQCQHLLTCSLLYFMAGRNNEALKKILQLRSLTKAKEHEDYFERQAAKLFVLAHFQAGNRGIAEREVQLRLRKYAAGQDRAHFTELYQMLKRIICASSPQEEKHLFAELKGKMQEWLATDSADVWQHEAVLFIWVDHHLSGKSMRQVTKEHAQHTQEEPAVESTTQAAV